MTSNFAANRWCNQCQQMTVHHFQESDPKKFSTRCTICQHKPFLSVVFDVKWLQHFDPNHSWATLAEHFK